jgi:hypothetical protein
MIYFDTSKTLTELENADWDTDLGEPNFPTQLVIKVHKLRKVPLNQWSNGDIRVIVGQKFSLNFVLPLALERLQENPSLQATFFAFDLLATVARIPSEFWREHKLWQSDFDKILDIALQDPASIPDYIKKDIDSYLTNRP